MMDSASYQWGKMSRKQPYVLLATDILRAILTLRLGESEGAVLAYLLENTWGRTAKRGRQGSDWPDTVPFPLDLKTLENSLQIHKPNVVRAIRNLVDSRIILKIEGGYVVNKEAHTWTHPQESRPRLAPHLLSFAASAQRQNDPQKVIARDNAPVIARDNISSPNVIARDNAKQPNVIARDNAQNEEAGAGKPYGVIEEKTFDFVKWGKPQVTSTQSKTRKRRQPKQARLPLQDQPIKALPLVLDPSEVRLHAFIMSQTRTKDDPDGQSDLADHVVREFRGLLAKGYSLALVRDRVHATVKKVGARNAVRFSNYLLGIFEREAEKRAEIPDAPPKVLPSQTKPVTYHRAPPLLKPSEES